MGAPRVSVLIPTHDRLKYLPEALDGVYAQTFRDFEVVVVDDGSTDGTAAWLRRRRYRRLRCIRFPENRGPAKARNRALRAARGELVAFLDSDDAWDPGYLATLVPCFETRSTLAAVSDIRTIDARGGLILDDFYRTNRKVLEPRFRRLSGLRCVPSLTSTVFRRAALDELGGFDEGFKRLHDDKDLFYRFARRFGRRAFRFVPRTLARHRRHDAQMTSYIEDRKRRAPTRDALPAWKAMSGHEREMVLDLVYFSAKHPRRTSTRARGT